MGFDPEQIAFMRRLVGIEQWRVAKAMGKSQAYLSYLETGRRELHPEDVPLILAAIEKAKLEKGIKT